MMIEIKCYEVIDMYFFMLFFLTVKFPQNRCLVTSWEHSGIHHIGAPGDLIVFIVFHHLGSFLSI